MSGLRTGTGSAREIPKSKCKWAVSRLLDLLRCARGTSLFLVMMIAITACGCGLQRSEKSFFAQSDAPGQQVAISSVQSFLYLEPSTETRVPQVRGSIFNRGNQPLIIVELTFYFKDLRHQVIFEDAAYPVFASALSNPQGSQVLAPGQQLKFAFKFPACPKEWQPGQVDVRVTKVVASPS
jgi:hypothetical protein